MAVTCALFGPLRDAAGRKHVEVSVDSPSTVIEVLRALAGGYPQVEEHLFAADERLRSINVTLNGDHIEHLDGLETAVADGDVLRLAPPVTGGADRRLTRRVIRSRASRRRHPQDGSHGPGAV